MTTVQEKLNVIKQQEGYIVGSIKLEYTNHEGCKYSYLCENCEENAVRKYVFYSFTYDSEKNIEDQTVTGESDVDCNDLQSIKITDGINNVEIIEKALKTYPIETTEVRWTTEADFNKGTHDKTQTISDEGGGVSLFGTGISCYACWHLNETEGTNVADSSGNLRNGTTSNMLDDNWVVGKLNNCLLFDGVSEYVDCGDIANFERNKTFSIEAWFKTNVSSNQTIISRMGDTAPYRGWGLVVRNNGYIRLFLANAVWTNLIATDVPINYADNSWHHVIATYDGSSSALGVHIYVDGVDKTLTIEYNSLSATMSNTHTCCIAGRNSAIEYFIGNIDEVIIYDKELNSSEVAERWNGGAGREWNGEDVYELSGTYTSNTYDSGYPNKDWDKIFFNINLPTGTTTTFKVRTSNDGIEWGEWSSALANGDDITDNGRFIQWKSDLTTTDDAVTPKIFDNSILYLENRRNVLPP